ncbi:MAG: GSCFA domain-containing protein [Burkholderiales bacterium]|nr:GSCFA domain-containing protein [Burkholderiales bacterium]
MSSTPDVSQIDSLMSLISRGKWPEAESTARMMTQDFPAWILGWKVLGVALGQMGRLQDALIAMQKTAELSPGDAEAHGNLGVMLRSLQRQEDAEKSLRRALEIAPNSAVMHFNLGNVYADMARFVEAQSSFHRALELQPDYSYARTRLDEVTGLANAQARESAPEKVAATRIRNHPYTSLPARNFWKTAVADRDALDIDDLWRPKFSLTKDHKVVTTGSCFAQHISRALQSNGFNWVNAEPAPPELDEKSRARAGYDVFSFRVGNVYTARQLRQWISWACDIEQQSREVIEEDGRYFDPFRPTIPEDGYASEKELWAARDTTLRAIRHAVESADIFVFTLGLTEAWMNRLGFTYPLCPGTARGAFSEESHFFHNFTYEEILADLHFTFDEVRKRNPNVRFLLTVSPVPLTATATHEHVLVATTRSKSTLRAAAGFLAEAHSDVDYFPSYEIITGHPFEGCFFDANCRTVKAEGVAFVMRKFLAAIEGGASGRKQNDEAGIAVSPASDTWRQEADANEDVVCEEIILDSWNRHGKNGHATTPRILLIGDSQMGLLADAMAELKIPFSGGGVMWASQWHTRQFTLSDRTFFEPSEGKARIRWQELCANSFISESSKSVPDTLIFTNVGMQTTQFLKDFFDIRLKQVYGNNWPASLPFQLIDEYLLACRSVHLMLVKKFVTSGSRVICVSDPPVQPAHAPLYEYIDSALLKKFRDMGCDTFNAREWLHSMGKTGDEMRGADGMHGNAEYYRLLLEEIRKVFSIDSEV